MSFQIETALVNAYRSNIEIQYQQKGSRLRPYVRVESQNAEFEFYDRVTPTAAQEVFTRNADTPLISTGFDRRQVGMRDFDWADLVDKKDKLRMLADPTSPTTTNAVYAMGRAMDQVIIDAAFATVNTGKTGATQVAFPGASIIAVNYVETGAAVNTNLTIAKLRFARFLLTSTEAQEDGEQLIAAITASQIQSLLRTTEITNGDYNTIKALVNGDIDTYMGFKFVRTELLTKVGNIRQCIFWAKSGLLLALADELMVDVGPRRDKRNSIQVYVCGTFGGTRMWEQKVLQVLCDETA